MRAVCEDRNFHWYVRAQALDAAVSVAQLSGEEPLEAALAWSARIAADESEEWDMRLCTGNTLLNFPRDAYRPLLEDLAARRLKSDRTTLAPAAAERNTRNAVSRREVACVPSFRTMIRNPGPVFWIPS
jgi:hypothetical protein